MKKGKNLLDKIFKSPGFFCFKINTVNSCIAFKYSSNNLMIKN